MKICKVKLINWHAFENETLEFTGNLIITGSNASGKSTLMDAIYYVLSGGDTKNFNNAANNGDNHNSKRTLETYIRHKIGDEGREFLRSVPIISHICIEFSQDNGESFVLGAVIELNDTGTSEKFYTKNNIHIEDSMFVSSSNTVSTFNELKHKIEATDITKTSKKARMKVICEDILKLNEGSRYMDLLQRAIAFRPIEEVSDFVDSFLLDEESIDIVALKEELRSYYGIHNQVIKTKEKIAYLATFIDQANKYQDCLRDGKFYLPLYDEARIDSNNVKIQELNSKNEDLNHINKTLVSSKNDNSNKLTALSLEIKQLEDQEVYRLVKSKKDELKALQKSEEQLSRAISSNDNILKNEQSILNTFHLTYSFRKDIQDDNFSLFEQHRKNYREFVKDKNDELVQKRNLLNRDMLKISDDMKDINLKISELKNHHNIYPDNVRKLQRLLTDYLRDKYKKEISIRPLCEFLEFKKNEMNRWSKAIEAYLAPYRFGLIVDYKYYEDCVEYYDFIKVKENVNDVRIYNIDTPFIPNMKANDKSVFNKLEIVDRKTKYLCYLLFNDVICYDSLSDLRKQEGLGLLDDCTIYKDRSFYIANPEDYQFPYIGEASFQIRIERLEAELEEKNAYYDELANKLGETEKLRTTLEKNRVEDIIRFENVWDEHKKVADNINKTKEEISLYEKNSNIITLNEKINQLETEIQKIQDENAKIEEQINSNQRTIGSNETAVETLCSENKDFKEKYEINYYNIRSFISQYDSFKSEFYDEKHHLKLELVKQKKDSCFKTIASLGNQLSGKVHEYVSKYNNNLSEDLNNIGRIINEYERLKGTDIIKFELQAEEAKRTSEMMFRDDFISKLSGNIKTAKETINGINKNLANHPFGTDKEIYRFICQPSKDEEMKQYYNIITSGKLMAAKDLFSDVLSDEENDVMNSLFHKIVDSGDDFTDERNLARLLDYRKYMTYDIEIKNERGEKTLFSKTHREKSGGETQTPFYVIIASCFDQLMDKKKGYSSCPVIFDEAFNNMDETRIDALMRYYRELGIQLIIVVPSNRLASLAQFVDTVAGLMAFDHQVKIVYLNNGNKESYE